MTCRAKMYNVGQNTNYPSSTKQSSLTSVELENTVGRGKNAADQQFSPFPTVFSSFWRTILIRLDVFYLSSAEGFN